MHDTKLDFKIKLLSGNNVVMVEANGCETEIFMPHLLNGRISFLNIIPNRRCCSAAIYAGTKLAKITRTTIEPQAADERRPLLPVSNSRAWRLNGGNESRTLPSSPLAKSTPAVSPVAAVAAKDNRHKAHVSQTSSLPTPETARRANASESTLHVPSPRQVVKDTLVKIPSGVRVIRLYRDRTPNTPKHVGRIMGIKKNTVNDATSAGSNNNNTSQHNSTSRIEDPPLEMSAGALSPRHISEFRIRNTPASGSGTIRRSAQTRCKPATPGTVTKWRKCITPVRTYSRRPMQSRAVQTANHKKLLNASTALQRARAAILNRIDHQGRVMPNYMINPTQGAPAQLKVEVKKRKLIIDAKTSISPRSFKRQQQKSNDRKEGTNFKLPRNRKELEATKHTAFDMLTNSNRVDHMSAKLNQQFRNACINKKSETYPKYKVLCALPPLESDNSKE